MCFVGCHKWGIVEGEGAEKYPVITYLWELFWDTWKELFEESS